MEVTLRHHLAVYDITTRVCDVSALPPLESVEVVEASGRGGEGIPAATATVRLPAASAVAFDFLTSQPTAEPRRFSASRETYAPAAKRGAEIIVITNEPPQVSSSSESSAFVRRSGRLARKRQAAFQAAKSASPPAKGVRVLIRLVRSWGWGGCPGDAHNTPLSVDTTRRQAGFQSAPMRGVVSS